jgi:hypothetical protein
MSRSRSAWLVAGGLALCGACGDREPPPPPAAAPAPQAVESLPAVEDSLRGDSVMVRDTARIPE